MGNRANVCILQHPGQGKTEALYLYTHWHGARLPRALQDALKRGRERWDDEAYLGRIVFWEMLKLDRDSLDGLTGFGISTYLTDNDNPILIVNCQTRRVGVSTDVDPPRGLVPSAAKEWTFDQYCDLLVLPWDDLE